MVPITIDMQQIDSVTVCVRKKGKRNFKITLTSSAHNINQHPNPIINYPKNRMILIKYCHFFSNQSCTLYVFEK